MANEHRAIVYPDLAQAIAFHKALMGLLGRTHLGEVSQRDLSLVLSRMSEIIRDGEGDVFWIAAEFLFDCVRNQPFGPGSKQTAVALTLAFLLRNGIFIAPPEEEEILGVVQAVADGAAYVAMVEEWLRQCARPVPASMMRPG